MLLSKQFQVSGIGNGQDQVTIISPWEDVPIKIVGAELIQFNVMPCQYVFLGNFYAPDIMVMMGHGCNRASNMFPAHTWFDFPARGTPGEPRLCVHRCSSVGEYQIMAVVYYTKPALAAVAQFGSGIASNRGLNAIAAA